MLVEVEQPGDNAPLTITGCPIKFTETPSGIYSRAPMLGEHTEQILAEAGITLVPKEKTP
jgi:crotonobetainyl-CoA:carnitine CoA-transferase CaiB-like acyl-CoA transferase